jgi:hypothetical protein
MSSVNHACIRPHARNFFNRAYLAVYTCVCMPPFPNVPLAYVSVSLKFSIRWHTLVRYAIVWQGHKVRMISTPHALTCLLVKNAWVESSLYLLTYKSCINFHKYNTIYLVVFLLWWSYFLKWKATKRNFQLRQVDIVLVRLQHAVNSLTYMWKHWLLVTK